MDVDVFNEIDQIINLDIGGRKSRYLYRSARKSIPLCLESAELMKNSKKLPKKYLEQKKKFLIR